jgi:peptidoglycan/xylan/chitin deacetylase (PgdA/CDA1 family)
VVQRAEIEKTETLLKEKLKVTNTLFAPPSGDYNQTTVDIAHELNLQTVLWTIDTVDWKDPSPEWIVRKISTRLEPGSLILMHPTSSSSQALKNMIQEITNKGYAVGTVSDLISPQRLDSVETPLRIW